MEDLIEDSPFQIPESLADSQASLKTTLEEFYASLITWSMISPSKEKISKKYSQLPSKITPAPRCREFLDQFCWLGDFDTGGQSVTSAGIESLVDKIRYWVASNHGLTKEVINHLTWVLKTVERSVNANEAESNAIEDQIVQSSVQLSFRRARQYKKWLMDAAESVYEQVRQEEMLRPEVIDSLSENPKARVLLAKEIVGEALAEFCTFSGDLLELCDYAYNFRRTRAMQHLNFLCEHEPSSNHWCSIRHRIGRLGSWRKAARTLITTAKELPWLVHEVELQPIYTVVTNVPAASTCLLQHELGQILPQMQLRLSPDQNRVISSLRMDNTEDLIKTRLRSWSKARVHSECAVAEFFHQNNLEFACGDRYVGSSKPSCYCCTLYLKFHPGKFASRPSHGNTWIHWLPPGSLASGQSTQAVGLLKIMCRAINQDIRNQAIQRRAWKGKSPDSATNITSPTVTSDGSVRSRAVRGHTL